MFRTLLTFVTGYGLAAIFSSYVSFTVTATLWANFWTYVVLLFWWVIGGIAWVLLPAAFAALIALLAGILAVLVDAWKHK